ncbi:hypothetical protein AAHZ94_00240 [Streptomyces sp. HSW2009]|uniref:hypothetical protein n=1 Tax=Streptomyces sp. HSW2009 TaxID=3142890 RepID=UPI0032EE0376
MVRTTFRERLDAVVYDYWPQLRALDARRFPNRAEVVADFLAAGFRLESVDSFAQPVAAGLADYRARLTHAPQSKFTQLTDAQFTRGLARMEAAAAAEAAAGGPRPVLERYDVAVFALPTP